MAETTSLLRMRSRKVTEGSNPSLSAINFPPQYIRDEYIAVFVCRDMGKKWGKISPIERKGFRLSN